MNDVMKEYDLPQFHGEEAVPAQQPAQTETAPQGEPAMNNYQIVEGTVVDEPETVAETQPPSKLQRLWRTFSAWALGVLSFALAAYLVFFFAFYQPIRKERDSLLDTTAVQAQQILDANETIDTLTADLDAMTVERDGLLSDQALYQGYVPFLDLKNDLLLLQKAYLEEDSAGATLALTKTLTDLEAFVPYLTGTNAPMTDVLRGKIALLSTVEADTAANIEEVETIYDFLLELEDDIFGGLK